MTSPSGNTSPTLRICGGTRRRCPCWRFRRLPMSHTAELIAVGTEILLGNIANTDAQMLSEELAALGVNVLYHTVVGDNPARLAEALELARRRVDIVITTGGLGPTYDDLTKQTICTVFWRKNVFHPEIADALRTHFASIGRELTENNLRQAYL